MDFMLEKLLKYVGYDTQSNEENESCPSTPGQLVLAKEIVNDLKELGLDEVELDDNGYIYATLKGNTEGKTIGFISHMDTAPDLDGKCENPQIIEYKGGDIKLNSQYSITEADFPFLKDVVGHTIITTDGTTLLGADDKAGISIIMNAIKYFIDNPEVKHADVKVGFTPDEEIGRGADLFDIEKFGADFAYTIDGGPLGGLEYENFNAASAKISFVGKNVHPGSAKNIMINASKIATEFNQMLPQEQVPEYTQGYEGFYLLLEMKGDVENAQLEYIIRDHSMDKFEEKKEMINKIADLLRTKYSTEINVEIKDTYFNMRQAMEKHMYVVELAKNSMQEVGVTPVIEPIRGGTDGAGLTNRGLPTPNLFTGGYNYHGRYEFVSYDMMKKASETLVKIIENNVK